MLNAESARKLAGFGEAALVFQKVLDLRRRGTGVVTIRKTVWMVRPVMRGGDEEIKVKIKDGC
jgi:hypothetical protein